MAERQGGCRQGGTNENAQQNFLCGRYIIVNHTPVWLPVYEGCFAKPPLPQFLRYFSSVFLAWKERDKVYSFFHAKPRLILSG